MADLSYSAPLELRKEYYDLKASLGYILSSSQSLSQPHQSPKLESLFYITSSLKKEKNIK